MEESIPVVQPIIPDEKAVVKARSFTILIVGSVLVLALILIALFWANSANNKPTQTNVTPTPSEVPTQATSTPTAGATSVPTISATPMPDQNVVTSNPNTMKYTSYDLGITFEYQKPSIVKRVGNKIYVSDSTPAENGQSIEVFTKEPNQPLQTILETVYLKNYDKANCFVKTPAGTNIYPSGYERLIISTPTFEDLEDLEKKLALCPAKYTASNGVAFFLTSTVRTDRYAYVSIGQYAIAGSSATDSWDQTIRFIQQ